MTIFKGLVFVAICGLFFAGSLASGASAMKELELTVCSLSANPGHFAGRMVVLSGQLNSDGIERIVLTDNNCEGYGVAIATPDHFKGEADFIGALEQGHPGTLDKKITGTFVGKFIWQPRKVPKRVLVLKEVRDLSTVTM